MDDVLDKHPAQKYPVLPAAEQQKFEDAGWMYLKCQNFLASKYNRAPHNLMLFDVTIKSHYMTHVLLQSREENPRSSWCYGGEHLMSDFKKLEALCVKGRTPAETSNLFSLRYGCYWHFSTAEANEAGVSTWITC